MFYSTFGYAQLAALINVCCTPIVVAVGARDRGRAEEIRGGGSGWWGGGRDEF